MNIMGFKTESYHWEYLGFWPIENGHPLSGTCRDKDNHQKEWSEGGGSQAMGSIVSGSLERYTCWDSGNLTLLAGKTLTKRYLNGKIVLNGGFSVAVLDYVNHWLNIRVLVVEPPIRNKGQRMMREKGICVSMSLAVWIWNMVVHW